MSELPGMAITIGANIASLGVQRRLQETGKELSQVSERLASGMRINRAADDAAGLAIADSLRTDARVYGAAVRNINDGISVLDFMASALDAQSQILIRMRELAENSANGVNSTAQRSAINSEYQALLKEFNRIGDTTKFNGISLLNQGATDSVQNLIFQVGNSASSNSRISVSTGNTGSFSGVLNPSGNYDSDPNVDSNDAATLLAALTSMKKDAFFDAFGQDYFEAQVTDSSGTKRTIYGLLTLSGYGSPPGDDAGYLSLLYEDANGVIQSAANIDITSSSTALSGTANLNLSQFGTTAQLSYNLTNLTILPSATYGSNLATAIDFTGVSTANRARHALDVTARRATELNVLKGQIGAAQSRMQAAAGVAGIMKENSQAAESSIRDADIAADAARLVRTRILQQAGVAVLSQANIQPQLALMLLTQK